MEAFEQGTSSDEAIESANEITVAAFLRNTRALRYHALLNLSVLGKWICANHNVMMLSVDANA